MSKVRTLDYAGPAAVGDRPWVPSQLMAIGLLFGPVSAGVAAGVNFKRLGKPGLLGACVAVGVVVFAVMAVLVGFVLEDKAIRPVALLMNVSTGTGFLLAQKPTFDAWKARHFPGSAKYRPSRIGLLFGIGLACAAAQVGVLFAMLAVAGRV
ncbi:MAG TPA: hypothetical protein VEA69_25235 [Tepidisphaeraceae bacterium]|nr:hypothetical protein [Tepidisphaeraceae bacterium]